MANLVFDFLHHYQTGERRASDPADAYQYDEGHVMEAVVPVAVTSCEIHYWVRGQEEAEAYVPESITQNDDGSYSIIGHIPNTYFETYGELRVYIVVTDGTASITTYEGRIHICERSKPDDYVDDDPDNEAVQIIAAARGYAETSEAWAVGQINGEDVPSTADQYQNNASYYADQAASAASSAAAQASLAPAYDNTATYEVGDYCLYSGQLYECTTAITTAEAWDSTHWTAVTVGGELSTVKDGLTDMDDRVTALEQGGSGSGLTDDIKQALLQIAEKIAYIDEDGQDYYDALENALYPPVELASISATYTQSGTVYNTDTLDSLKSDLVVTANYSDQTAETVTAYTLSGTLTEGTSVITVSYGGKTTTFNVTVSVKTFTKLYDWDLTESLDDSVQSLTAVTNGTQDSSGLTFSQGGRYLRLPGVFARNRTYEIDVYSILKSATTYGRLFMVDSDDDTAQGGSGYIIANSKGGDLFYMGAWESSNVIVSKTTDPDGSYYSGSTLGFYVDADGYCSVYKDGTLLGTSSNAFGSSLTGKNVYIGSTGTNAERLDTSVFTGYRIYEDNIYS